MGRVTFFLPPIQRKCTGKKEHWLYRFLPLDLRRKKTEKKEKGGNP